MANISIRISDEERDFLMDIAKEYEVTLSWVGRKAIKEFITNYRKEDNNGNNLFIKGNERTSQDGVLPN